MSTPPNKPKEAVDPESWKELLYTPARVQSVLNGTMTFRELHMLSADDMRSMAVTGYQLFEQGRFKEAKTVFEGLNALDPSESYFVTAIGAIYSALDDLPMAIQVLNGAIKLNDRDAAAFLNRGEAYLRQGKWDEGARDLQRVIELDPKHESPLTVRAAALARAALVRIEREEAAAAQAPTGKSAPAKPAGAKSASKKRK